MKRKYYSLLISSFPLILSFILFYSLYIKEKLQNYPPCFIPRLTSLMTNECFCCIYARALVCVCALRFYLINEALSFSLSSFFSFGIEFLLLFFSLGWGFTPKKGGPRRCGCKWGVSVFQPRLIACVGEEKLMFNF